MSEGEEPPNLPASGRPVIAALQAALQEIEPGAEASNLRRIVRKLIADAIEGDLSAMREIFDRVDGKPVSASAGGDQQPRKVIVSWKSN